MIKTVVISDIRLYREGIGRVLGNLNNISVVGVVENYAEILNLLEQNTVDIVLVDMRMPNGNEILSTMTLIFPDIKIIVIALPENDDYLLCIESGVAGYLSKESAIEDLVEAIIAVNQGSLYCPCNVTQCILKSVRKRDGGNRVKETKSSYLSSYDALTRRELQIVKLLAEGMPNKKIAQSLTIEVSTVKNHVHNILVKMGVENRSQVASLLQNQVTTHNRRSTDLDPKIDRLDL